MATDFTQTFITTKTVRTIVLRKNDVLEFLRQACVPIPGCDPNKPIGNGATVTGARVEVTVPSGADWSGMAVDIDHAPVTVTLTYEERKQS